MKSDESHDDILDTWLGGQLVAMLGKSVGLSSLTLLFVVPGEDVSIGLY